jgi:hypothetical protein
VERGEKARDRGFPVRRTSPCVGRELVMSRVYRGTSVAADQAMRTRQVINCALAALVACAVATGCGGGGSTTIITSSDIEVVNNSDFAIVELYITEVDNPDFGPNLLAGDALLPGEDALISLDCDVFDVLLIDDDGVDCQLFDVDTCANDATLVINNNTCDVFNAAAKSLGQTTRERPQVESPTI